MALLDRLLGHVDPVWGGGYGRLLSGALFHSVH